MTTSFSRVGFGTNYISETNSISWRLCLALQGVPALLLAVLTLTLPYTPRWLVSKGRKAEALKTLAWLRKLPEDSELIQLEYIEIQAESIFESETTAEKFPHLIGGGPIRQFRLQAARFGELFTTRHMFYRTAGTLVSNVCERDLINVFLLVYSGRLDAILPADVS